MTQKKSLEDVIKERILILDGAMGTMIQHYGLTEADYRGERFKDTEILQKGNNDLLVLTRPDVIKNIHCKYLEAGADIIETNTFNAQRISMSDYGMEDLCVEINKAAGRLAREIADQYTRKTPEKPRFVAASIGPTNKTCSMSPDVNDPAYRSLTFDELVAAYTEQMSALLGVGIDAFLIETIFDTLNAKAAIYAAENAMNEAGRRVPIMLSATISDKAGRLLSGQTLEAFLTSIQHAQIFSIGLNCSFGAREMKPFLKGLAEKAPYYISAYPNAGLPNDMGQYDQTPELMAEQITEFVNEGIVNVIGGCCGTTDAFIAKYTDIVNSPSATLHKPAAPKNCLSLSGLESFEIRSENNFVNIGERCNVAGSKKFRDLIEQKRYDEAISIARKQVNDGAQVLDINMDDGLLDSVEEMRHFLNLIASEPEIARIPIMIDSSNWQVIEAGLRCMQGKGIVNSISLKGGEKNFLEHAQLIQRFGAAVVVMAFDEKGQADTFERKIEVCKRSYDLLVNKLSFNPHDIIFDPNVLSIATGLQEHANYAVDFINAAHWIRENLPGAHISGGISNLSFSYRGNNYIRQAMHAVFLYHAIDGGRGMDMGIVNPSERIKYADIPTDRLKIIEDAVLNRTEDATEQLISLAQTLNIKISDSIDNKWRKDKVENRLKYALINGVSDYLSEDIKEALEAYPHAVDLIEGPLMDGMNEVGKLFGEGKMFLPQVIKTARTMKQAVTVLQPYIEAEKSEQATSSGKVLLATVKGDVHDIGKNIVSVVMACNNYEIVDLGVMCPAEDIVRAAKEEKVDIVGLSGLITPSLTEMVNVAKAMEEAGLNIPIMIGGATTSLLHTALKIAPVYSGPVVWQKDASCNAITAAKLLNPQTHDTFVKELNEEYELLRKTSMKKEVKLKTIDEARKNKLNLFEEQNKKD